MGLDEVLEMTTRRPRLPVRAAAVLPHSYVTAGTSVLVALVATANQKPCGDAPSSNGEYSTLETAPISADGGLGGGAGGLGGGDGGLGGGGGDGGGSSTTSTSCSGPDVHVISAEPSSWLPSVSVTAMLYLP